MPFLGLPTRVTPPTPVEKRACSDSPYLCKSAISKVWWGIFWVPVSAFFLDRFQIIAFFSSQTFAVSETLRRNWLAQATANGSLFAPQGYAMGRNKPAPRTSFLMYQVRRIGLKKAAIDLVSFEPSQLTQNLWFKNAPNHKKATKSSDVVVFEFPLICSRADQAIAPTNQFHRACHCCC